MTTHDPRHEAAQETYEAAHETTPQTAEGSSGFDERPLTDPAQEPTPMAAQPAQPAAQDQPATSAQPAPEAPAGANSPALVGAGNGSAGSGDPSGAASSTDQVLFAGSDLSGLRSRWTDVQSAFVDDPRVCVQKADGLVADVVETLTSGFGEVRARLEQQWDRGEEVSTEDLRIALTRYREFFDRLIAI